MPQDNNKRITDPFAAAKDRLEREHPKPWIWDDDGEIVAGVYVGAGTAELRDGTEVPTRTIKTEDAGYRTVWLFKSPQDLRRVMDALDAEGLAEGDYVMVQRYPKRQFTDERTGEKKFFVPFEGTRIPAAELGQAAPAAPASVHAPLEVDEADAQAEAEREAAEAEIPF